MRNLIGIYEKALPAGIGWRERLTLARKAGYDFLEISIDETDERLGRLEWDARTRQALVDDIRASGTPILSMCFSGHRRFPLGSHDADIRTRALDLMEKAIDFAATVGIHVIQLAGYDVYYEASDDDTKRWFLQGLREAGRMAAARQVMLAMEIMDTPFINSISRYLEYDALLGSPWFTVYPDLGNLTAWGNDVEAELEKGFSRIVAVHVKDTLAVTDTFPGKFKEVPFGAGCVDFPKAFRKLKALGYAGPFLVEMWTEKATDPMAEVVAARQWLEEQLVTAGYDTDTGRPHTIGA